MEEKLREYAHLIVSVGLNLQKGQTLILSSPVECAPFARLCVSAAYDLGAGEVVLNWTDDCITRERFLRAQDAAFEMPRPWRRAFFTDYANEGAAYLRIDAEDPETLLGVSPARLVAAQRTSSAERETFDRLQMANGFPWCVAGAPIAAWARKVFPDRSEGDAVAALWDAILKTVRVTGDGNAEARWREHIALLTARKEKLNALRFKSLHYTNSLGTDLTIALPDDHLWAAGNSETPAGVSELLFHGRGRNENALLPVTSFPVKSEGAVAKNSLSHGFAAPAPSRREPDMTVSCEASLIEGGGIA